MTDIDGSATPRPDTQLTHFLYLMHALAPFTAWLLAVGAVVVGMATRDKVTGTFLDSHYSWLQRTFFWGLLWFAILCAITVPMLITLILIPLVVALWAVLFLWYLYRVIRGWVLLNDGKPAPF
jgi:uncharacterized membrane protein